VYLHHVDGNVLYRELLVPVELVEHVSARTELEQQDQVGRRSQRRVLIGHKRVQDSGEHLRLLDDVLHLK